MSEKVGGAEGTKLDEDFKDLERVRGKSELPLAGDGAVHSRRFKIMIGVIYVAFRTRRTRSKYNHTLRLIKSLSSKRNSQVAFIKQQYEHNASRGCNVRIESRVTHTDTIHLPALCVLQKADITSKAIVEVVSRTSEYLQPNPGNQH